MATPRGATRAIVAHQGEDRLSLLLGGDVLRRLAPGPIADQGSLPTEDAALILLFGLVVSGQITLRKIDGHASMAAVISTRLRPAA